MKPSRLAALPIVALTLPMLAWLSAGRSAAGLGQANPSLAERLESNAVDLTYTFDEHTIYWPTDEPFHWRESHWGPKPDGSWYASATYGGSEHGGTHLDAPVHFAEGQPTADQIPLDKLIAPAVVVDVSEACRADRDYLLQIDDLAAWEQAHGRIPEGAIVLVRTGWGRFWPDKQAYLGSDEPGDVAHLHFPGIGAEAARWLVRERRIDGIGIDTASLDHGPSTDFRAHREFGEAGVFGLENVANLERVPETGATLIALPMKIGGGSGGPTRVIAILP